MTGSARFLPKGSHPAPILHDTHVISIDWFSRSGGKERGQGSHLGEVREQQALGKTVLHPGLKMERTRGPSRLERQSAMLVTISLTEGQYSRGTGFFPGPSQSQGKGAGWVGEKVAAALTAQHVVVGVICH